MKASLSTVQRSLWILFVAGLMPVIFFSTCQSWTWGIMDEPGMVMQARRLHTSISFKEKLIILFPREGVSAGMFKPLWYVYVRGRLALIDSATAQHTIQLLLILAVLVAWWRLCQLFTAESIIIPLGLLMTLYFGPFTVAGIGFLSIQELPGLALFSWALYFSKRSLTDGRSALLLLTVLGVLGACLMKETFFCLIPTVLYCLYSKPFSRGQKATALILTALFIGFPIFLWTHVRTGYSAGYTLNVEHLFIQTGLSLKNLVWTYKFGMPLLIVGLIVKLMKRKFNAFDALCLLGAGLYFAVLVPWTSQIGYYQGPIAPFLGFLTAGCCATLFSLHTGLYQNMAKAMTLVLALFMVFSIGRQTHKTHAFNTGIGEVQLYLIDHLKNETVFVDGEEAASTLPQGMQLLSHRDFKNFVYLENPALVRPPAYVVTYGTERRVLFSTKENSSIAFNSHGWIIYHLT